MTRRLAVLLLALLASAASAQPLADTADLTADSVATLSPSDSLAAATAAQRAAEGAALDSLLTAHPDVLAARLGAYEAAQPWWRRWWTYALTLGALALAGLGLALAAFLRAARVDHEVATLGSSDGGPAARTATQAAARADASVAALSASVTARLGDLERTRAAVEAQITQTANLLDRAERLGLFRDAFKTALAAAPDAAPSPPAETPDASSTPEPSAA